MPAAFIDNVLDLWRQAQRLGPLQALVFLKADDDGSGCPAVGEDVSAVWPPDKPFEVQDPDWPPGVSEAFRACFNEVEET